MPSEEFVSEPITPDPGTANVVMMTHGEPGLPTGFTWRDAHYAVAELLEAWKTNSPGEGQVYLRRHWYRIRTEGGQLMTLYCLRQARPGHQRWWLYTMQPAN